MLLIFVLICLIKKVFGSLWIVISLNGGTWFTPNLNSETLDSKLSVEVDWQPGKKWKEKLLSQFYPISLDFAQFRKIAP